MIQLFQFLEAVHPMTPELEQAVRMTLKVKEIPRGKHWLREGEVCNNIAFIETGLLKIYTEIRDKEVVVWFNKEFDAVISVRSFFRPLPSRFAIQAMEDTRIWYASHADLTAIYHKHPGFNINGPVITEEYYYLSEDHVMLMHLPAQERYYELLKLFPWIQGRITDKDMAAYLGITNVSLSKIKNGKWCVH